MGFLSSRLRSQEGTAIQMGGGYCRTNWRCAAVLSPRPVGVGVSESLLILRIVKTVVLENVVFVICPLPASLAFRNQNKQIKGKNQFETVSRNGAFCKTVCGDNHYPIFYSIWEDRFAK